MATIASEGCRFSLLSPPQKFNAVLRHEYYCWIVQSSWVSCSRRRWCCKAFAGRRRHYLGYAHHDCEI
jgi:hypothetical protein